MAEMDDVAAIGAVAANGPRARAGMELLFDRHYRRLVTHLRLRHPRMSEDDATDVASRTFLKAFSNAGGFRGNASLITWLAGIAENLVIDGYRHETAVPMISADASEEAAFALANLPGADTPLSEAERRQLQDCVRRYFEEFRLRQPQAAWALWARHVDEASPQEIAPLLGRTYGAARQYLSESAKKLEVILAPCLEHIYGG